MELKQTDKKQKSTIIVRKSREFHTLKKSSCVLFQPDLIKSLGYPVEEHFIQSQDGYIVTMHRIPHGYNNTLVEENKPRPVVLLAHCMMASSVVFTFGPTNQSLAYLLADEGRF